MSAKSTSHEAAQKRVWKAEIKNLRAERRQTLSGFNARTKRIDAEILQHEKAIKKLCNEGASLGDTAIKGVEDLDRRIAILQGRISG